MADDAAVIVGIGAIIAVGVGIWWITNRQRAQGAGGGLFGGGGAGGPTAVNQNCTFYPSSGNYCWSSTCTTGGPTRVACAKGGCAAARSAFISGCAGQGGSGGGTAAPNCGDCNHLNCAGVQACLNKCPPFDPSILSRCGIQNIGGSIITPGTGSTGGRPTTGGAIIPCIVDEATRRSKCPNLCSCSAAWFYQGTNTPCNPTGAEVAARADQCGIAGGTATPGFTLNVVHRPWYNRVFYNPQDEMRLVIAS